MTAFVVSAGQTSTGLTLNAGDTMNVLSGGTASNTTNNGGTITVFFGGTSDGGTTNAGGQDILSGGLELNVIVNSGGSVTVSSGGTVDDTFSGGSLTLSAFGRSTASLFSAGASATILASGSATSGFITSGSTMTVSSGGTAAQESVGLPTRGGGVLEVSAGGSAFFNGVLSGGQIVVSAGGVGSNNQISAGGSETILGGGSSFHERFFGGGLMTVSVGGVASFTSVTSAGVFNIIGGTAVSTTVTAASMTVSGGSVTSTSLFGSGAMTVSGGSATGVTLLNFLSETLTVLGGGVVQGVVLSGGTMVLSAGGSAITTTVTSGGKETILPGGIAIAGAGAILDLQSGSTIFNNVSGGIIFGGVGGQLEVDDPSMPTNTISGLVAGDTFDLTSIAFVSGGNATLAAGNVLTVTQGGNSVSLNLDPSQNFAGNIFQMSQDAGTGTLVTEAVCFCRGTMILTDKGEIPVERLAIGDRVETLSGAFKPIVWIGVGRDLVTRANKLARPVIVGRGALADNVPCRDLYLTHGHALYLDGVLIPVENLINHRSIRWDDAARVVEYYHIELEDHDVVFAEGAPTETYYDAGNRALFQTARPRSVAGVAKPTFAPVLTGGDVVDKIWAELLTRSGGPTGGDTTDDPDLHLVVDGKRLVPELLGDCIYGFRLEATPVGSLHLSSRSGVPSLLGITRHDHRRLGIAISRIELRQPGIVTAFEHDAPLFVEGGCHPSENGYCWTDGRLELPAPLFAHVTGPFILVVHTEQPGMRYPISTPLTQAA